VTFGGVIAVIRSKYLSWQEYKKFYDEFKEYFLPQPLAGKALHWGVTTNTWLSLMPDVLLPFIFFVAWLFVVTLT